MAPRKPPPDTGVTDELPAFFKDALDGGVSPTRAEVWRLQPNGPAYVGEPPLDATAADLIDFVRGEDKAHGRSGGVYQAKLKDAQGKIITNVRFRVDRDGELKTSRDDDARPANDPVLAGVGTLVTMLEQQARSYEARVRADMSAREQQARLDADRRRAEAEQERAREREFWGQQRERDRELADQARERDRAMYTFLLQAKPGGEGGESAIKTLMAGIALAHELGEGGGRGGDTFGDKIIARLGDGFMRKVAGDDDATPTTATPATPKREAPVEKRGARRKAPEPEDEPSDAEKMADMLELLVLNTDEHAAATVIESLIKNGKLPRALVGQLAKGKLDEELEWDKDALDKVHKAAEVAYRATAPRSVPNAQ
jgi:hypothetical protein